MQVLNIISSLLFFLIGFLFTQASFAKKVISLGPAITELIYELGQQKNLIGTTTYSNFPNDAKKILRVGSYHNPNWEIISRLKPEHLFVFSEGSSVSISRIKTLKIPFSILSSKSLNDFEPNINELCSILICDKLKNKIIENWNFKISKIKKLKIKPFNFIVLLQSNPLIVVGGNNFIDDSLSLCGGINVFKNHKGYPKINREVLASKKIDVVILAVQSEKSMQNWISKSIEINSDVDALSRLSSRHLEEVLRICSRIKNDLQ